MLKHSVMNNKFQRLAELGAGDFNHIDGSLIDHLKGTQQLLKNWSASKALEDAGLYHAAYGTAEFDEALVSVKQRNDISKIIGPEAEDIVYLYCACDRKYFWPQIGLKTKPIFKNRFTGSLFQLNAQQLQDFCELTVANEIEIALDNQLFIHKHGEYLFSILSNMSRYISKPANDAIHSIFK